MAKTEEELAQLLKNTKFKKSLIGGIDENDVWEKLQRLQNEYTELVNLQREQAESEAEQWRQIAGRYREQILEQEGQLDRIMEFLKRMKIEPKKHGGADG